MSRPTKLTPNTIKMVAEAVRQGLTNQDACRATGIHVASPDIPSRSKSPGLICQICHVSDKKRARARGHRENLRKPNIEAANARDRNLAVNDLDHAPKVSEGDSLELDRYSVGGSAAARG